MPDIFKKKSDNNQSNDSNDGNDSNKPVAWINYGVVTNDGGTIKAKRGLPLFQNPEFPCRVEDLLIKAAELNGGEKEVTFKCVVRIRQEQQDLTPDML